MGELTAELFEQMKIRVSELEAENNVLKNTVDKQDRMMNTLIRVLEVLADKVS